MQEELLDGAYRPGAFTAFVIQDPKERVIHAAPFRDRVLHHALVRVWEPFLERRFDNDSYACRKGRGMDAALNRARAFTRKAAFVLKTDIEKCYPSIDHAVLMGILRETFKDGRLLDLLAILIDHGGDRGRGLPIGNLTSQWFANLYLDRVDRFIRHELKPSGYVRYMDDMALFGTDRHFLAESRRRLGDWIGDKLLLRLKEKATQIHATRTGWPFLGFRVLPSGLRLRRQTWRRFVKRLGLRYHLFERGRLSLREYTASVECMIAHQRRADAVGLRRKEMRTAEL